MLGYVLYPVNSEILRIIHSAVSLKRDQIEVEVREQQRQRPHSVYLEAPVGFVILDRDLALFVNAVHKLPESVLNALTIMPDLGE